MTDKIVIAYSLKEQYMQDTYISLLSVCEKVNCKNVDVILLHNNTVSKQTMEYFYQLEKTYTFLKIIDFVIEEHIKDLPKILLLDSNMYSLFLITNFFNYDKILYLNSGIIVEKDFSELFAIDLKDNYIAATQSIYPTEDLKKDGHLTSEEIFSSALLLFNCNLCKKDNIIHKFCIFMKTRSYYFNKYSYLALNILFKNKWLRLEQKYNLVIPWNSNCYNKELVKSTEYKKALKEPSMIFYHGCMPQFVNCQHPLKHIWWQYAKMVPFKVDEWQSYKLSATTAQNSFQYGWLLSRIWPYIKPYMGRIIIGFLIAIPLGLLDGVTAFALKPYMDYVVGGKALEFSFGNSDFSISSLQMAYIIPLGVILFAAFQGVLRYLNSYISSWTSQRITNDVKLDLFHNLINMHPQFFDDNASGIVISRYMSDPKTASAGIVDQIKTITTSLCGAMGLIAVMLYSSWKLAFVGVLVLCIAFIPVILIRKRIREASNKNMVIGGNITTNINETYSGNKVMAAYGLQDRQEDYFRDQIWESFAINMSLTKRTAWMSPMMYQIASIGIAVVLGYGTYLINSGQMTAGAFASFVTSLLLLYKPVKTLGNTLTGIQNIFVAMGRVFELFDLTPAITDCKNPQQMAPLQNEIRFENVLFEYVPNKPVLRNINLTIPKNETLAIVGNSGGGKSTLVNLIPRFYDIKSGSIKFDGVDIKDLSIKSLRKNISMVFQDNFLFTGTIKENIMMGNPDATTEELMAAIKAAHLQDMITELPDGLDTELGERGLTLSGGQRQRVAIARAMLRNAPIVILDEATSALDNESEAIVQKAMDNLMQNRTVFIIAHRLSTIKNANRIAVINEGELVELGSHEDLMQIENGQYKALYEMQFRNQEVAV